MNGTKVPSPPVFRSVATLLLVLLIVIALVGTVPLGAAPLASSVVPTPVTGNTESCTAGTKVLQLGLSPSAGIYPMSGASGTITISGVGQPGHLSWSSTPYPLVQVIMKGSNSYNVYNYPANTFSDSDLVTPTAGGSDGPAAISHVVFCANLDYQTPTATSVPPTATSVPPTATATGVPPTATATGVPPQNTPTATSVPPQNTPTATATGVPPTATATGVPPQNTPTATSVPPQNTPTATSVPPQNTPTATATNTRVPDYPTLNTPTPGLTSMPVPQVAVLPIVTVLPAVAAVQPQAVVQALPATGLGGALPIDPPLAGFTIAALAALRLMLSGRGGRRQD